MPRNPLYRRYKLYFYRDRVSSETWVPHRPDKPYKVVDAMDDVHARKMGEKRHPDLICVPKLYPRKPKA